MATTTTNVQTLFRTMKLRKIEVWAPSSPTTFQATADIEIQDGAQTTAAGLSQCFSDTALGATALAHVVYIPRKNTPTSMWFANSTTAWAIQLNLPAHAVVDIHLSCTLLDSEGATGTTITGPAVVGQLYMLGIDAVTGLLTPVSFPTIT